MKLLSHGIVDKAPTLRTVQELVQVYGKPHAKIGGGKSIFQYLSDKGTFIFVTYDGDRILNIGSVVFSELKKYVQQI